MAGTTPAVAVVVAVAALAAGCAKPGPPGGGPTDSVPPFVVRTEPSDGAVAVDTSSPIEIEFSEEMNRLSVERAVSIVPPVELRNLRWKGKTLVAEPLEALPESVTVVFELGATAQDYHSVAMAAPFALAFSTGEALDTGVIAGAVTAGGDPAPRATVWACTRPAVPDSSGTLHPCGYTTTSRDDGTFRLSHVRATGTPYTLLAFLDANGDRRYTGANETGAVLDGAAAVEAPGDSAVGIVVPIEPPEPRTGSAGQEVTE